MKLSTIILAKTASADLYQMTLNAIDSLLQSESEVVHEIIIVESNPDYLKEGFAYDARIKVLLPNEKFNFHKFLNYGIQAATGDYIALCNNDLIFHPHWFSAILTVSEQNTQILSFSPSEIIEGGKAGFEIGYKVMTHIKGWCLVVKKELVPLIGPLDEQFDFYFADNDYALTLIQFNVPHALVYASKVEHLAKRSTKVKTGNTDYLAHYSIPKYLYNCDYTYVLEDELSLNGFLKYQSKWGSPNWIYKKKKVALFLMKYKLGIINRFFLRITI